MGIDVQGGELGYGELHLMGVRSLIAEALLYGRRSG
jgi:hypothetical protein